MIARLAKNDSKINKKIFALTVHPHNKHTLFALTKMCLFGEEEDFKKINSSYLIAYIFFNIESLIFDYF